MLLFVCAFWFSFGGWLSPMFCSCNLDETEALSPGVYFVTFHPSGSQSMVITSQLQHPLRNCMKCKIIGPQSTCVLNPSYMSFNKPHGWCWCILKACECQDKVIVLEMVMRYRMTKSQSWNFWWNWWKKALYSHVAKIQKLECLSLELLCDHLVFT